MDVLFVWTFDMFCLFFLVEYFLWMFENCFFFLFLMCLNVSVSDPGLQWGRAF